MRKKAFCVVVVLYIVMNAFIANASVVQGPFVAGSGSWELVPNGNFEVGDISHWVNAETYNRGYFDASSEYSYQGNYSVAVIPSISFNGPGFAVGQNVSVNPDQLYVLSGFFNTAFMTSGYVYLDLTDIKGDINVGIDLEAGLKDWQFAWGTITIPAGVSTVNIRMVRDGETVANEIAYIDEIALTPLSNFAPPSQVPIPATIWLLGSGLGFIIAQRRLKKA